MAVTFTQTSEKMLARLLCVWLLAVVAIPSASAQTYPNRSVRFIVPWPAGGGADVLARMIAPKLAQVIGQPVVIDNRGGAAGNIGTEMAAKADADGYTIVFAYSGTVSINPHIYSKMPFTQKDFDPVIFLTLVPEMLVVRPSLPISDVRGLIALAKASPGKLTYGSAGNGAINHLTGELFAMSSGIELLHVPFRGGGPALNSVVAGQTDLFFGIPPLVEPLVKAGRLKALAMTGAQRSPSYPDLPTIAESGIPGYEVTSWNGILVPAGTPLTITQFLNQSFNAVLTDPEVRAKLIAAGYEPIGGKPEQFTIFIAKELEKWGPVVKKSGAQADPKD